MKKLVVSLMLLFCVVAGMFGEVLYSAESEHERITLDNLLYSDEYKMYMLEIDSLKGTIAYIIKIYITDEKKANELLLLFVDTCDTTKEPLYKQFLRYVDEGKITLSCDPSVTSENNYIYRDYLAVYN